MMMMKPTLVLLFLIMAGTLDVGQSRFIIVNSSELLVSDGINNGSIEAMKIDSFVITCEPMYGFLPCTTNLWGQIFLFVVYQYLLYLGDKCISSGSELIFKILGHGVFGASAFHLLGSLPEAVLVLVSGIYGNTEKAQGQVMAGMRILAGSTVLLLTLLWGFCGVVDWIDLLVESKSLNQQQKWFNLIGSGLLTTDIKTNYFARIMLLSMVPFILVELPHIFGSFFGGRIWILTSLIVTFLILVAYGIYQVFQPWIRDRSLEYLINKYVRSALVEKLLTSDGKPNIPIIKELFHKIDMNNDRFITHDELRGFILGIQFEEMCLEADDFVDKLMQEFDLTRDANIDEEEYVRGISKLLCETQQSNDKKDCYSPQNLLSTFSYKKIKGQQDMLLDKEKKVVISHSCWTYIKAAWLLLQGTFILTMLTEPIIDTIQNISNAANIPSFFIFFIAVPIVLNCREAISAISSIRQKTCMAASLTFSEIYGAVFMNNIIGLTMFLGIVYARGLTWNFSAEVLVVLIICIVMGLYGSYCNRFPLWTSIVACLLYPVAVYCCFLFSHIS